MKLTRQTKIKFREINQNGSVRFAPGCLRHEALKAAIDSRQMGHDFSESNDGDFLSIDQQVASISTHFLAAHAKEGGIWRKLAQRFDELSAVCIARSFAGGKQKIHAD